MTIAVIGRGLIGSAAARHLAEAGESVMLIGPAEPADKAAHRGVFGSHYDEGRITRALDPEPFWSRVSRASIARYPDLEARSGIDFFSEVGTLMAGPEGGTLIGRVEDLAARDGIACDRMNAPALAKRFPYYDFPDGTLGFFERAGAGHISPRRLVAAQTVLAQGAGAEVVDRVVIGLAETDGGVEIETPEGAIRADRALVAAGGFTNMVLPSPLPITVYARTVALFEVDEAEAGRLAGQPSLIWLDPSGEDPYLLPAIRYPDGRIFLKLGGDPEDIALPDSEATKAWFRSGGAPDVAAYLETQMRKRMPDLVIKAVHRAACVTTYSARNMPIIAPVSARIAVATAGNGRGAKNSDELGRLGAEAVLGRADPALAA